MPISYSNLKIVTVKTQFHIKKSLTVPRQKQNMYNSLLHNIKLRYV